MVRAILMSSVICFAVARHASAQAPTTVQLPTFQFFTVETTVSIPNRGSVAIAGNGGAGAASLGNGAFFSPSQSSRGITSGATSMSLHATIHDLEAMDAALLGRAADRNSTTAAAELVLSASRGTSVVEAQRQRQAEVDAANRDAAQFFSRGRAAEDEGKPGAAKVWYNMASRRATGALKVEVDARLAALFNARPAKLADRPAPLK